MNVSKKTITQLVIPFIAMLFVVGALFVNMKVHSQGVPYYQVSRDRHPGGAFESSGSTSRYALTETIANHSRLYFDKQTALFASPDVAGSAPRYYTLFAPGISFLGLPFYYVGKSLGYEQFVTYLLNVVFAVLDCTLIILIIKKYGYSVPLQIFASFVFIFATNAFVYSLYYTQHIISAFLVLLTVFITLHKPSILNNILIGIVFGIGLIVDIPNAFLLFPPVLYQFLKHFEIKQELKKLTFTFKYIVIAMAIGLIPLALIFGWYNKQVTGSPTLLPQFLGRNLNVANDSQRPEAKPVKKEEEAPGQNVPFQSRLLMNGMYILFISDERGWLYYSPILFIGLLGMALYYKNRDASEILFVPVSIFLVNSIMYAMFGDVWGGWAFGPRYLIPAAAVTVLFIPTVIERFKKNMFVYVFVTALVVYSIYINTLGAVTTTEIPPKQEAEHLVTPIPYTYQYNLDLLEKNESYSMLNTYVLKKIPGKDIWFYESLVLSLLTILPIGYYASKNVSFRLKRS